MKAVIPAAGFGTRMLPAAKAVPKEMLPVLDRPTIQYVVEEAAEAGAEDVLLVVSNDKKAIEDHFDRHAELERRLAEKGRSDWLASVRRVMERVQLFSVRQREPLGLGHAVLQAQRHVGDEAFLCLLGDAIFSRTADQPSPAQQLVAVHRKFGGSVIGLERVPRQRISRYGVAGGSFIADDVLRLDRLVEKPAPDEAPSDLAIAARYLLSPGIFGLIEAAAPGAGGEIQLTDALHALIEREPVHGVVLQARRHDIGNPVDWLRTNLLYASRDPHLWEQLRPMLDELMQ